jgi:hypothetical protein
MEKCCKNRSNQIAGWRDKLFSEEPRLCPQSRDPWRQGDNTGESRYIGTFFGGAASIAT